MKIKGNKAKEFSKLRDTAEKQGAIEQKLDELITLLAQNEFDSETVKQLQDRFNTAIEHNKINHKEINAYKLIGENKDASREDLLDEFSTLLLSNKIDSRVSTAYLRNQRLKKTVLAITGVVMITLGMAMIIMPAPPYFEMFTIYYFNINDGITLMDLISLIVVLCGIYILVRSLYQKW